MALESDPPFGGLAFRWLFNEVGIYELEATVRGSCNPLLHPTAQSQQFDELPSASQNLAQLPPPQGWNSHLAHLESWAPCWHLAPMHGDPSYVQGLP